MVLQRHQHHDVCRMHSSDVMMYDVCAAIDNIIFGSGSNGWTINRSLSMDTCLDAAWRAEACRW